MLGQGLLLGKLNQLERPHLVSQGRICYILSNPPFAASTAGTVAVDLIERIVCCTFYHISWKSYFEYPLHSLPLLQLVC